MNEQMKQELIDWGFNFDDAMARFMGKEELVYKFVMKFLNDKSFTLLSRNLDEKNVEEAFKACHTLKGVASNLSLDGFKKEVVELTEILRAGSLDGADGLFLQIKNKYDALISILERYGS